MPLCTKVLCRRSTAAASARRCSVVAPAASPAHKAQLTTALMAQGWCHESVDIATAQGAVQQLRATVPHRSSVAAADAVSPLQRRRCTKRMWTTGLHSWHKLTGVRIHCHCTRCCAAPEGYLSTAMFAASTGRRLRFVHVCPSASFTRCLALQAPMVPRGGSVEDR